MQTSLILIGGWRALDTAATGLGCERFDIPNEINEINGSSYPYYSTGFARRLCGEEARRNPLEVGGSDNGLG